jgi:hypothetical protein
MHSIKSLLGLREIHLSKPFTLDDFRTGQLFRASYRSLGSVDSNPGSVASMLRMRKEGLSEKEASQKAFDVHGLQVKMISPMTEAEKGSATTCGDSSINFQVTTRKMLPPLCLQ